MFGIGKTFLQPHDSDAKLSALELLRDTPLDRLEQTVKELRRQRSAAEVREAMIQLIATAPLSDFGTLKHIYMVHCADAK